MNRSLSMLAIATLVACGGSITSNGSTKTTLDSSTPDNASTIAGFPVGTYGPCSTFDTPNTLGGSGGTITLSESDDVLVATFSGTPAGSLDFEETSSTSATIRPAGQSIIGGWTECGGIVDQAGGIADPAPGTAPLILTGATLTYNASMLFLSMVGNVDVGDGSDCSGGPLSAFVTCPGNRDGGEDARASEIGDNTDSKADAALIHFPVGVYQCTSALDTYHSAAGGNGTLTVTQSGTMVTATYAGDYAAKGTLEFVPTSDGSANPAPGQTFEVFSCAITFPPTSKLDTETVTSGSLTFESDMLFLSILGMPQDDSACNGASATLTLICDNKS
jgi:hypothetical protein